MIESKNPLISCIKRALKNKNMARECVNCWASSQKAVSRSHSNIGTIHRQRANLQKRWIGGSRVQICTSCLKMVKVKAPALLKKAKSEAAPKKKLSATPKKSAAVKKTKTTTKKK